MRYMKAISCSREKKRSKARKILKIKVKFIISNQNLEQSDEKPSIRRGRKQRREAMNVKEFGKYLSNNTFRIE